MKVWFAATLLIGALTCSAYGADNLKAFPPAEKGMIRCVLDLPEQDDESSRKVELLVGKRLKLDERNQYFFSGKIEAENIKGWGFTKYTVRSLGQMAGTKMAINPLAKKVERFVSLGEEPYLIRYNSKLPVVVYVPKDAEVRYRIWVAQTPARRVGER